MISTAPGFLGKPYLPGYIFNSNIHFPTFSVTIILNVGMDSSHVITQEIYMSSTGAGKPEVPGDSILVALAFT